MPTSQVYKLLQRNMQVCLACQVLVFVSGKVQVTDKYISLFSIYVLHVNNNAELLVRFTDKPS